MRHTANLPELEKVFVLGAGASYSATQQRKGAFQQESPLDKDFCGRILQLDLQKPHWLDESINFIKKSWKDHYPMNEYGLEAAIIRQLGHMEFIDSIHARRKSGNATRKDYLNHLSHLICFILGRSKENRAESYRRFSRIAFPTSVPIDEQTNRIITFNYDCLLDQYLLNRYSAQKIYFDRIRNDPDSSDRREFTFQDPLIIKLHGSSNWHVSTDEFERIIDGMQPEEDSYFIDRIWHDNTMRPSPKDDVSPLIIPPLPNKPITSISLFSFLWTRAYEYLHQAKEIIVCGYSLPETDNLATSLFSNFRNENLERVTVVDPNPQIIQRWRDLFIRKGIKHCRWAYSANFQEYIDDLENDA